MKIRLKPEEVIYAIIALLVLIISCTRMIMNYRIMVYVILMLFTFLFILTLKEKNFSIYQVFLITFFVFLLGRVFLDAIGASDMKELSMLQHRSMSDDIALEALYCIAVYLIGTSFAWMHRKSKDSRTINYFEVKPKPPAFGRIVQFVYYIYLVLFVLKLVYMIRAIRIFGYLAFFNGTISANVKYPVIFTGVAVITETLFIILTFYYRDEKTFKKNANLLLVAAIVKMFTGQRGYTFVLILFILYIWSTYYREIKIVNPKIIIALLIAPVVMQVIWDMRYNNRIDLLSTLKNNLYFSTLRGQGSTLEVVAETIELSGSFQNKYPFLIGYFVDFFSGATSGQTMRSIQEGNYLGHQLTYAINSEAYLSGRGTGTSIVAEAYSTFGGSLFFVFLFGFLSTEFVLAISNYAYKNIFTMGISFYLLTDFIYSPRDSIFKSLGDIFTMLIILLAFSVVESVASKGKDKTFSVKKEGS